MALRNKCSGLLDAIGQTLKVAKEELAAEEAPASNEKEAETDDVEYDTKQKLSATGEYKKAATTGDFHPHGAVGQKWSKLPAGCEAKLEYDSKKKQWQNDGCIKKRGLRRHSSMCWQRRHIRSRFVESIRRKAL